jgi:hypothetical protein
MNKQITNLISKYSILTPILFTLSSCDSNEETQSNVKMEISLNHARMSSPNQNEAVILDETGEDSAFSLSSVEIMVRHIQLDLPEGTSCEEQQEMLQGAICEDDKITIEGPMMLDLLAGTSTPDLSEVQLPPGQYKRVDIRVDDGEPDEGLIAEDDSLNGYSMSILAGFDSDEGMIELDLKLKFNEDIRFESDEGVEVSAGGSLFAMLDPSQWFDADILNDCIEDGDLIVEDGVIFLDDEYQSNDCSDIENSIKDSIKKSGQLDRD